MCRTLYQVFYLQNTPGPGQNMIRATSMVRARRGDDFFDWAAPDLSCHGIGSGILLVADLV